ncbi:PREDICTED: zinc finger MYM-type protein 1-like [Camelina sativa]|uniref:Zinc finger MYM-type protein 1-like n=1 Tax=Camelina sativa TaxID=90675 RepID=A0ABM0VYX8_CAMSA|nr:PREDICTED: zinc finger MYM-type protein 1-like [Camelina sativa]
MIRYDHYHVSNEIPKRGNNYAFVEEGFALWNKPESLRDHVGDTPNTFHKIAARKCDDLLNQAQSIVHTPHKQDDVVKKEYRVRLNASIDASRYLLRQGLPFRGHNESKESANRDNFLELIRYTGEQNDGAHKFILENAPKNNQMISPVIQKDIANSFAEEVVKSIIEEIDHDVFALLVDESADISDKEQMAVVFRFVDKSGAIKERFVGVLHVKETSSLSLKSAIDGLFAKYGLSLTKLARLAEIFGLGNPEQEKDPCLVNIRAIKLCLEATSIYEEDDELKNYKDGHFHPVVSLLREFTNREEKVAATNAAD